MASQNYSSPCLTLEEIDTMLMQQNIPLLQVHWHIGQYIVMHQQNGRKKARRNSGLLENLSEIFTQKHGVGFSRQNLIYMRRFFLFFPCRQSPFNGSLTWTHYIEILKATYYEEVIFYKTQAEIGHWSVRQLKKQMKEKLFYQLSIHTPGLI